MTEKSKESRINQELARITAFFEDVDANQKANVIPLLQNAAFMKVTLEDLQEIINKDGVTEVYQNGANQHGVKQSATLQSYNALIKNYASVIKTLAQLLPRAERKRIMVQPKMPEPDDRTKEEIQADYDRVAEEAHQLMLWAKELE